MTARLQVLEAVVVNEGITWGVDDLDRRRNLVRESCTIGGESDHIPSRWPDVLRLPGLLWTYRGWSVPDCEFGEEDNVFLRVERNDVLCPAKVSPRRAPSAEPAGFKYCLPRRFDIFNEVD